MPVSRTCDTRAAREVAKGLARQAMTPEGPPSAPSGGTTPYPGQPDPEIPALNPTKPGRSFASLLGSLPVEVKRQQLAFIGPVGQLGNVAVPLALGEEDLTDVGLDAPSPGDFQPSDLCQ